MPIYEYECSKCGAIEEVLQSFSEKPLTQCRRCSGKLHKLISHSSFHLKGSGWYVTDYAKRSTGTSSAKSKSVTSDSSKETNKTTKSTTSNKTD
jgi:putative FmdB family regulatory protein